MGSPAGFSAFWRGRACLGWLSTNTAVKCKIGQGSGQKWSTFHLSENKTYFCSDSHLQSPAENWLENHSKFCPWKLSAPVWNPSQAFDKMGKPQPDILGTSKVKTSGKKSHLYLKDGHFKLTFKHVKQGKNLNCSAALELTNEKTMQIFVNRLKQSQKTQVSLSQTVHIKMENTPLCEYIPPCTRIRQSMNLWTAAYLRFQALV